MKKFIVLGLLLIATQAMAKDIRFESSIAQGEFRSLSKEAGAAISYRNLATAEPLGVTGFDAGVELTAVDIRSGSYYWKTAFRDNPPSYLLIPKIRARKGLPFGINVGAMFSYVPDSNIKVYGAEISKALLEGGAATPALAVRGTYTKLAGVGDLDLQTAGVDATISKGFLIVTPYAGGGGVWVNSRATGHLRSLSNLRSEDIWQSRFFGGVKISPIPLFSITAEAEYQVRPMYSLKAAVSF